MHTKNIRTFFRECGMRRSDATELVFYRRKRPSKRLHVAHDTAFNRPLG